LGRIIGVVVEDWFYADGVCVSVNFASHGSWRVFHSESSRRAYDIQCWIKTFNTL
jgi:hypothetical protein